MQNSAAMTIRGNSAGSGRGPWFLVALLLALASALVPALSPTGAVTPARMLGSAFDPTNDVKTLRGREQGAALVAASLEQARRTPAAGPAILSALVREMAEAAQAYPTVLSAFAKAEPDVRPRTHSPAQPRAPPAQAI